MAKIIKIEQRNYVPVFDLSQEPLMDIHNYGCATAQTSFIYRIIEMSDSHVVGMKM
jgi:UDP-3-O-[3-hydroxymyristoyl] N-acetylglucosamine deacetylase/3-hydroxyacyl-[acyl-carrier-protein] dehydratase